MKKAVTFLAGLALAAAGTLGIAGTADASPIPDRDAVTHERPSPSAGVCTLWGPDQNVIVDVFRTRIVRNVRSPEGEPCGTIWDHARYWADCYQDGWVYISSDASLWGWVPINEVSTSGLPHC